MECLISVNTRLPLRCLCRSSLPPPTASLACPGRAQQSARAGLLGRRAEHAPLPCRVAGRAGARGARVRREGERDGRSSSSNQQIGMVPIARVSRSTKADAERRAASPRSSGSATMPIPRHAQCTLREGGREAVSGSSLSPALKHHRAVLVQPIEMIVAVCCRCRRRRKVCAVLDERTNWRKRQWAASKRGRAERVAARQWPLAYVPPAARSSPSRPRALRTIKPRRDPWGSPPKRHSRWQRGKGRPCTCAGSRNEPSHQMAVRRASSYWYRRHSGRQAPASS